jgi:hypothetical protein
MKSDTRSDEDQSTGQRPGWASRQALAVAVAFVVGASSAVQAELVPTTKVDTEVSVGVAPALSTTEQMAQVDAIARRGSSVAQRLTKVLAEARRDKDILRANCVNRKLTEVNATVRNIEGRSASFRDSSRLSDKSVSSHEFAVLSVLSQKLDLLEQETAQCLGQAAYETGASQVVTTISASTVSIDPASLASPAVAPPSVTVPPSLSSNN